MQYISTRDLKIEFNISESVDNEELLLTLEHNNDVRTESLKVFLNAQINESSIFNSWIEQSTFLKNLLLNKVSTEKFVDTLKWKEHFLFEKFRAYLSPFFLPLISRKAETEINTEWASIFSFLELMVDDERMYLEQMLYQKIKLQIESVFSSISKTNEEAIFHQQLLLLLSDDCIAIHNSLSRASHSLKIEFTERILQLFYHPKCRAKLAHWMILQLEKMNLNEEQKRSLETIKSKIKTGEIKFSLTAKKSKKLVFRNSLTLVLTIAVFGIIYFFYNQKFDVETQNFKESSSLTVFTVKERKEIDSLLRSMKTEDADSLLEDTGSFGASISLRVPFKNLLAEKIYREIERDMSNHYAGVYDTCVAVDLKKLKDEKINSTSILKEMKGKIDMEWKNDSDYTLLIFMWEENSNSPVFSGISTPKSTIYFKSNKGMHLMAIPGIDYGRIPSKNKKDFNILQNHFCSIDFNFEYALQQNFLISNYASAKNRILVEGLLGNVINITDAQGVLESN